MTENQTVADQLADALAPILGVDRLPVRLQAWDGSVAGPDDAPLVIIRSPQAIRRPPTVPCVISFALKMRTCGSACSKAGPMKKFWNGVTRRADG